MIHPGCQFLPCITNSFSFAMICQHRFKNREAQLISRENNAAKLPQNGWERLSEKKLWVDPSGVAGPYTNLYCLLFVEG